MPDWVDIIAARLRRSNVDVERNREVLVEVAQELEDVYRNAISSGVSPLEAQEIALNELGDIDTLLPHLHRQPQKPAHMDASHVSESRNPLRSLIANIFQDLRFGVRVMARKRGFTALTIATLALGIGASTAMFSAVYGVLVKPLPYPEPDRLMTIGMTWGQSTNPTVASVPDFIDWTEQITSIVPLAAAQRTSIVLGGDGEPERIGAQSVSPDLFTTLGVAPQLGRLFNDDEYRTSGQRIAILSHEFWQRRWGGDPDIIGQSFTAESTSDSVGSGEFRVVGILPASFQGPRALRLDTTQIWLPLPINEEARQENRTHYSLMVVGRLKQDISLEAAQREIEAISERRIAEYPEMSRMGDMTVGIGIASLLDKTVGDTRSDLWTLLGASILILFISCANAANLLLARAGDRGREMALRISLGARRFRIARQLLCESLLLAAASGVAGVVTAYALIEAFVAMAPSDFPRLSEVAIDPTVLLFAAGVTFLTGLIFGFAPALLSARASLAATLRDGGARLSSGRDRSRMRNALVVLETALAMTLVVGAGLLVNSYARLGRVDPGFAPEDVQTLEIGLGTSYENSPQRAAFVRDLLEQTRAIPGVDSASMIVDLPIGGVTWAPPVRLPERDHSEVWMSTIHMIGTDYFDTMGIRLLQGSDFSPHDVDEQQIVTIVNETMARQLWPGESPLGKKLNISSDPDASLLTVVGVVNDVHQSGLSVPPSREFYILYAQNAWLGWINLVVRTQASAAVITGPIRGALRKVDPSIPFSGIESMNDRIASSLSTPKTRTFLLVVFATVAMALAIAGLYGTMIYLVAQRTQEIGIRMALGAPTIAIIRSVTGQGMVLVATGMAVGTFAAVLASKALSSMVFGIEVIDPSTYTVAAFVLASVGLFACLIPAHRATRTDLVTTLRAD